MLKQPNIHQGKGRILKFDGWTRVQRPLGKNEDQILPPVQVGDKIDLVSLDPKQHFTKPPARFTEAALVKELEKRGIGRPSTYASTFYHSGPWLCESRSA